MDVDSDGSGGIANESQIRFWIPSGCSCYQLKLRTRVADEADD